MVSRCYSSSARSFPMYFSLLRLCLCCMHLNQRGSVFPWDTSGVVWRLEFHLTWTTVFKSTSGSTIICNMFLGWFMMSIDFFLEKQFWRFDQNDIRSGKREIIKKNRFNGDATKYSCLQIWFWLTYGFCLYLLFEN